MRQGLHSGLPIAADHRAPMVEGSASELERERHVSQIEIRMRVHVSD